MINALLAVFVVLLSTGACALPARLLQDDAPKTDTPTCEFAYV